MRNRESSIDLEDAEGYSPEGSDNSTAHLTEADIFDIKERVKSEYADADIDAIETRHDELEEVCYVLSIELERDGGSAAPDRQNEFATLSAEKAAIKQLIEAHSRE